MSKKTAWVVCTHKNVNIIGGSTYNGGLVDEVVEAQIAQDCLDLLRDARTFAKSVTLSWMMCSVPLVLVFRSLNAVASSGLQHITKTRLLGISSGCFTRSSPIPQLELACATERSV